MRGESASGSARAYRAAISAPDEDLAVGLAALATLAALAALAALVRGRGGAASFPLGEYQGHSGATARAPHAQPWTHADCGRHEARGPPLLQQRTQLASLAAAPTIGEAA